MEQISKAKTFKIFLFAFLLLAAGTTNAQVGIGTRNPNASAQLDVSSTNKGFLPPRMTQAQRNAIPSPVAGLTIWCKDCGILGELQEYNGFTWTNMAGGYPASPVFTTSVVIGTQVWMTRNLDVVTYRNGDTIPQVTDPTQWANLTTGSWCYNGNDSAFGAVFGKLYNWYAVNDPRGLAPVGWNTPNYQEWETLINYLGGNIAAGFKMKATTLWLPPGTGGMDPTNQSGFAGLPGGYRSETGRFIGHDGSLFGLLSYYWTSTPVTSSPPFPIGSYAWTYTLVSSRSNAPSGDIDPIEEKNGFGASVRCLRN